MSIVAEYHVHSPEALVEGIPDYLCYFVKALVLASKEEGLELQKETIKLMPNGVCIAKLDYNDIFFVVYGVEYASVNDVVNLIDELEKTINNLSEKDTLVVPILVTRGIEKRVEDFAKTMGIEVISLE